MLSEVAQLSDEAMQTLITSGQTINVSPLSATITNTDMTEEVAGVAA